MQFMGLQSQSTLKHRRIGGAADSIDERDLVKAVAAGNGDAFDTLYDRHFNHVYAFFAARLASEQDAEDLTSTVFMRFWRNAASFRGESQLRTWLLTIARNAFTDFRRKHGRYAIASLNADMGDGQFLDFLPDEEATPDELALRAEEFAETWDALQSLQENHRAILVLRFVREKSYEQISDLLQLPLGTVKSRLYRAVSRLRQAVAARL